MDDHREKLILTLDVGTTQAKAVVFAADDRVVTRACQELAVDRPRAGWVEQDPEAIWAAAKQVMKEAARQCGPRVQEIVGVGVTGQRETVVAWDKQSSRPIYPAISWEDNRTASECQRAERVIGEQVKELTGLPVETYFSATKMKWILNEVPEAQSLAAAERLVVGTLDSWLVWQLGEAKKAATDFTNASRTLLFDIKQKRWVEDLLVGFGIPREILPVTMNSTSNFGLMREPVIGRQVPILAVCGDQQASLFAAGEQAGVTKVTYGTGTFIMQILGTEFSRVADFYTTLTAGGHYAVEAKIPRGGKEAEVLLKDEQRLRDFLRELANDVDHWLKKLPRQPAEIVIDGGVMRDGILKELQAAVSGVKVKEQLVFDGTALGVARLARQLVK